MRTKRHRVRSARGCSDLWPLKWGQFIQPKTEVECDLFASSHSSEGQTLIYWPPVYKASSQLCSTADDPFFLSENPFGRYLHIQLRSFSFKWSLGGHGVEEGR